MREFKAVKDRGMWKIVNRREVPQEEKIISLIWVFSDKFNVNSYYLGEKARIII